MTKRIAVIITSYNRRDLTVKSLDSLLHQEGMEGISLTIYHVDDGSTDGTSAAISERFPEVRLLQGDGSLYWNGGMRKAFAQAMADGFDAYLWYNDDNKLYPDALRRLVAAFDDVNASGSPAIVTGTMRHPETGLTTYGGKRLRSGGLGWHLLPVPPDELNILPCDSINGNFVLIPDNIARVLGNLDPVFRHQTADLDYGLRAIKAGFRIVIAPGFHGVCRDNDERGTWRDPQSPLRRRWKHLNSPKGIPWREWLVYTKRHYGWRWPIYFVSPFLKTLFLTLRTG